MVFADAISVQSAVTSEDVDQRDLEQPCMPVGIDMAASDLQHRARQDQATVALSSAHHIPNTAMAAVGDHNSANGHVEGEQERGDLDLPDRDQTSGGVSATARAVTLLEKPLNHEQHVLGGAERFHHQEQEEQYIL